MDLPRPRASGITLGVVVVRAIFSIKCLDVKIPCIVLTNLIDINECVIAKSNETSTGRVLIVKIIEHYARCILPLLLPHHVYPAPWIPRWWIRWRCLSLLMLRSSSLAARLSCLATSRWHEPLMLRPSWSLFIFRWRNRAILHLIQVTSTMKSPLNSEALAGVMPRFPSSVADNTKAYTEAWLVIRVVVVGKILPFHLLRLLIPVVPALVPTSLYTPLFIVELVLLLGRPFHIDRWRCICPCMSHSVVPLSFL